MNDWISVKDGLPSHKGYVMAYINNPSFQDGDWWQVCNAAYDCYWMNVGCCNVSHWRPLLKGPHDE